MWTKHILLFKNLRQTWHQTRVQWRSEKCKLNKQNKTEEEVKNDQGNKPEKVTRIEGHYATNILENNNENKKNNNNNKIIIIIIIKQLLV